MQDVSVSWHDLTSPQLGCAPCVQERAREELQQRMLAMRKRRKLQERGTAASEAGEPEQAQHIPAHRPTTQQRDGRGSHLQPSPSSRLVGAPARQQASQQASQQAQQPPQPQPWRSGLGAGAHHRLSPTPAALAESLSSAELAQAARVAHAPPAAAAAAGRGRHLLRQSQQLQPRAGGGTDSGHADRRASTMGDLQISLGGTGLGLTPRDGGAGSSLGPWRQQGHSLPLPPQQQQAHVPQHAHHHAGSLEPGEHLPMLEDKHRPQLRHAATISVRAGPLLGQPLPGQPRTAAPASVASVAAAAAAAAAMSGSRLVGMQSQRRGALDDSDHRSRRQPLGPEDSLSYGPPRHAAAARQREREREPAAVVGGSKAGGHARAAGPPPAVQQPAFDQQLRSPGMAGQPPPYLAALQRSPAGKQVGGSPGARGSLAGQVGSPPRSPAVGGAGPISPTSPTRGAGTQAGWKGSPAPHRLAAAASPPHSPSSTGMAASPVGRQLQGGARRQQQQQQQQHGRDGWSPKAAAGQAGPAASPVARQAAALRRQQQPMPTAGVLSPRRALNLKPAGAPAAVGVAGAASSSGMGAAWGGQRGRRA